MGLTATLNTSAHQTNGESLCKTLSRPSDREACTLGIVPPLLFFNSENALSYCSSVTEPERQKICFNAAFEWVDSFDETAAIIASCDARPMCATYYKEYGQIKKTIPDYRFGLYGQK